MSVWTDFENWRDNLYCGGEPDQERIEAEIGEVYELYDAVYGKVIKVITCTSKNKEIIENSLNDSINDMWWYRRAECNA